jgi:hypothetical protein
MICAIYPAKPLASFTQEDQIASRRYSQGCAHARQGRADLLGKCGHYDAGYHATTRCGDGYPNSDKE